jgi:hypothetical protein
MYYSTLDIPESRAEGNLMLGPTRQGLGVRLTASPREIIYVKKPNDIIGRKNEGKVILRCA